MRLHQLCTAAHAKVSLLFFYATEHQIMAALAWENWQQREALRSNTADLVRLHPSKIGIDAAVFHIGTKREI